MGRDCNPKYRDDQLMRQLITEHPDQRGYLITEHPDQRDYAVYLQMYTIPFFL